MEEHTPEVLHLLDCEICWDAHACADYPLDADDPCEVCWLSSK